MAPSVDGIRHCSACAQYALFCGDKRDGLGVKLAGFGSFGRCIAEAIVARRWPFARQDVVRVEHVDHPATTHR